LNKDAESKKWKVQYYTNFISKKETKTPPPQKPPQQGKKEI